MRTPSDEDLYHPLLGICKRVRDRFKGWFVIQNVGEVLLVSREHIDVHIFTAAFSSSECHRSWMVHERARRTISVSVADVAPTGKVLNGAIQIRMLRFL